MFTVLFAVAEQPDGSPGMKYIKNTRIARPRQLYTVTKLDRLTEKDRLSTLAF